MAHTMVCPAITLLLDMSFLTADHGYVMWCKGDLAAHLDAESMSRMSHHAVCTLIKTRSWANGRLPTSSPNQKYESIAYSLLWMQTALSVTSDEPRSLAAQISWIQTFAAWLISVLLNLKYTRICKRFANRQSNSQYTILNVASPELKIARKQQFTALI